MEARRSDLDPKLLDALPLLAWVADDAGDVWYVNEAFRGYTGRDLSWHLEHGLQAAIHPDDVARTKAAWRHAVAFGGAYEVEYRLRRHDGAYRWHADHSTGSRDAGSGRARWIGICTDVHARRTTDLALEQARRQVDEQFALLDALQDNAPIGLGFLDPRLRLVRANRMLVASIGRPLEEVLGRPLRALIDPETWKQIEPYMQRVATERESVTDIEVTTPDGDQGRLARHWSVSYYPIELFGEMLGIGILAQEQTERLERIRLLQSSEELRGLAERAGSIGSWEYNVVAGTSRWSPGLRAVLGVGPDHPTRAVDFASTLHPGDRERFIADVLQLRDIGRPSICRYRVVWPDGSVRLIETRAASDHEDDHVVRVYGTTQDVTESVRQEERVKQIEQLLTEAETMAGMGSFETLLPSGDTLFSPGLRRLLGYGEEGPIAEEAWRDYIDPVDRARQDEHMRRLLETGEMETLQLRLAPPGGPNRLIEIRGTCYRDADGTPQRLIGTVLDVTERERLRGERETLLERSLTAADHERRRIAEHLHDDAVQALTATLLRLDHAQATGSTEPLTRARSTLEAAVRSLRLNIMELAPVDLADHGLEAAVAAYAEQLLELDGVTVTVRVALGDESAIPPNRLLASYQIFREALANVRRHAACDNVLVSLERESDRLVGEVTDDGVGLSGEPTTRPGHLGTQLMRQRAELAGGKVTIRPREGGSGTTVAWELPL